MVTLTKKDFRYLMSRADDEFRNVISSQISGDSVIIMPAPGKSFDDVALTFGGLIEDTLDEDYEATPETYKIEAIWDRYFVGHGDDYHGIE
ncbi:hypothetical protein [Lacticaseibacillus daqingensis]|uniref:hypothetical protein n=1 Tax=Lacticaseibacillus daqingensis TaxID=2486014 RepID=UPI000F7A84B4|nr:hypothetical protein [Lacticaseibacillus daqingensis]